MFFAVTAERAVAGVTTRLSHEQIKGSVLATVDLPVPVLQQTVQCSLPVVYIPVLLCRGLSLLAHFFLTLTFF